jgi:hypothetical protein
VDGFTNTHLVSGQILVVKDVSELSDHAFASGFTWITTARLFRLSLDGHNHTAISECKTGLIPLSYESALCPIGIKKWSATFFNWVLILIVYLAS